MLLMKIHDMTQIFWEILYSLTGVILSIDKFEYKAKTIQALFDDDKESQGDDTLTDVTIIGEGTSDCQII